MGEEKINLAINLIVKSEVLKRIDLIPAMHPATKDKLYTSVERARKMGLVVTVPFGKGRTALAPADIQALKAELEKPQLASLRSDPTAVFVVLGFADPKGDAKMNLAYSGNRADAVADAMKHECGVLNVVHPVAMGGATLLDAQKLEKNRIAEVWVVLP
jgi:outer membrane protein OmpA-like peptidoglycan-associated protein